MSVIPCLQELHQQVIELLQRQQLAPLQHPVDILLPLRVRPAPRQGPRVRLEFPGIPLAERSERPLDQLVPGLEGEGAGPVLRPHCQIEALHLRVHGRPVHGPDAPVLPQRLQVGEVLAVVGVYMLGDCAPVVTRLDERLLHDLRVGVLAQDRAQQPPRLHVLPGYQHRPDGLLLPVGRRVRYPYVERVRVRHQILHHLQRAAVPLALDLLLVLPLPQPVRRQIPGALRRGQLHQVPHIPPHCLAARHAFPAAGRALLLERLVQHLHRAAVVREVPVEPDVLDDGLLLLRQAGERGLLPGLPAQRQRPEVVPAVPVLRFQPPRPDAGLLHALRVTVQGLRAHAQSHRQPLCVSRPVRPGVVQEVLHPPRQFHRLVVRPLVLLDVAVQIRFHVPGRRLSSLLRLRHGPDLRPVGPPPLLAQARCGQEHKLLPAALPGLRPRLVPRRIA